MQSRFFEVWIGTWPDAIDWTRAVMGTHIAAGAHTFSRSQEEEGGGGGDDFGLQDENVVGGYFAHLIAFYFGQDALALRMQAYDDMLWVVLGWLDAVQLAEYHSDKHFLSGEGSLRANSTWYGRSFEPAFAHRARIFWELASAGWDEELCGGGMIWSPWLTPYKNAITNQLFIAASINMYLYFPGDDNGFPFVGSDQKLPKQHDKKFLDAAVKGYDWLIDSNMTDDRGLFFDGFHIRGWSKENSGTRKCDVPDKMVYTYNQGVILSAYRGLWSATGKRKYLSAGHELVRNVIAATGWSLEKSEVISIDWSGLGRNGILEEACDSGGYCSQDGQTFKGIFFHHLTVLCQPLPLGSQEPPFHKADRFTAGLHLQSCLKYIPWIERNAKAAMGTMNDDGVFGMWWTIGVVADQAATNLPQVGAGEVDYRNQGIPNNTIWRLSRSEAYTDLFIHDKPESTIKDPNDRGRGRTIETQSGGVAILRARSEFRALGKLDKLSEM